MRRPDSVVSDSIIEGRDMHAIIPFQKDYPDHKGSVFSRRSQRISAKRQSDR